MLTGVRLLTTPEIFCFLPYRIISKTYSVILVWDKSDSSPALGARLNLFTVCLTALSVDMPTAFNSGVIND